VFKYDADVIKYGICLRNSWQCAISHVFNISGDSVNFICSMIDELPLDLYIINRRDVPF